MFTTSPIRSAPTFVSSGVVVDWSKMEMPAYAKASAGKHRKFDAQTLLSWVQSCPVREDVHVLLGNVSFTGQRVLQRQLQALGCRVTCRQYQG